MLTTARAAVAQRVAFGLLLASIVWAPFPLGSNRPWSAVLLVFLLWASLLLASTRLVRAPEEALVRLRRAAVPLVSLTLFAAILFAQLANGIAGWPATASVWPLTLDPYQTRIYLLTTLGFVAAVASTALLADSSARVRGMLGAIVFSGVIQALLAVVLFSGAGTYDLFFYTFRQGNRASGTYPNPDHLAGLMELALSAGLGLMLAQMGEGEARPRNWRTRLQDLLTFLMSTKMLLRLTLVVMVIALVLTRSRMGNGAFFLSILLIGAVVAFVSQRLRRPAMWLVLSMVVVDIVIIGQWVGLDRVVDRLHGTTLTEMRDNSDAGYETQLGGFREESLAERMKAPRLSLELASQRPWFGHGGGSFATAFTALKQSDLPWYFEHAHNDYLEFAADTGYLGLSLLLTLCLASAWRSVRLLRDRQPRLQRGVGAAVLLGLCTMGLHSLVDFNLQIPSNALALVLLLALCWSVECLSHRVRSVPGRTAHTTQSET